MSLSSTEDLEDDCWEWSEVVLSEGDNKAGGRTCSGMAEGDAGTLGGPKTLPCPRIRRPLDAIASLSSDKRELGQRLLKRDHAAEQDSISLGK